MFERILIRVASLIVLGVSTSSSWGCVDDGPPIVRNHLTLPVADAKDGFSLTRLDLLTVVLPGGFSDDWRVEMEPAGQEVVIALSKAEFQSNFDNHRFLTVHTTKNDRVTQGKASTRLHFGANSDGKVTLRLVNERFKPALAYVMDITVRPVVIPPPPPRGITRSIEADQQEVAVALEFYDKLEITLPGDAADEWYSSSAGAAGLRFVGQRASDVAGKVILTFEVTSSSPRSGQMWLAPKRQRAGQAPMYRFRIEHLPTSVC